MTTHLSEEQMVALLHGTLAGEAREEAKRHLGACSHCADALAREAALDEVLWETRRALGAPAPAKPRRRRGVAWLVRGTVGVAATLALGYAGFASATVRSDMTPLLAWQNVIFYIPLAVGVLLVFGSAFGGHHHEAGADHDADHDVGHGHDGGDRGAVALDAAHGHDHGDTLFTKALSILGVGRVPLTIILMMASLLFGGIGILLNAILSSAGLQPWVYGPISVAAASIGSVVLTGSTAKLLHRIMPTTETYRVSRHDFAGCTGTLLLPADASSGYAQVKDHEGNVHNIKCRTVGGELPKGKEILVVEYDEDTKTYVVDANPVSGKSPV